ncbi:MAG TPA: calcium/sodium antiporter [Opitutaceae bacterium]|nr:calcium/sodium antiporter [Opitutaceae bacterium]
MTYNILMIAAALGLLFVGAEGLVRGSASLAVRAGLSPLLAGLTIVAFGTSSPELVVSIRAALAGQGDISVGNVVGSNVLNIGLILGLTALICPIPVHRQIIKIDAPIALGVAVLLPLLLLDKSLSRLEGSLLTAGIVAYTAMNAWLARRQPALPEAQPSEDLGVPPVSRHYLLDLLFVAAGLATLVFGSRLLVDHSVVLAKTFGVSEAVIGLTIVAAGTSMPELATSLVAAIRRQPDIAVGNVVGSNVFNLLGIMGVTSLTAPLHAPGISMLDYAAMVLFSILLLPLLYTGRILHRVEGAILVGFYGLYVFVLWPK